MQSVSNFKIQNSLDAEIQDKSTSISIVVEFEQQSGQIEIE